jgi:hypothetical protein
MHLPNDKLLLDVMPFDKKFFLKSVILKIDCEVMIFDKIQFDIMYFNKHVLDLI